MARILIVEDEKDMQFILSDNLAAEGHEVDAVGTGREGLARGSSGDYALIVLDLMLPDIGGVDVCKEIRARDRLTPIIMLTARGDEIDKVVGLEVGADDYVTKPFGMREFLARVKVALRRAEFAPAAPEECLLGDKRVDFVRREVAWGDRTVGLTRYESDLLRFLAMHRGRALSRRRILEGVWGGDRSAGNRTVDNCVARLRAKFEQECDRPRHILTVHGVGYKLL